ncbi:DUF1673 family protein [Methanosarcina sp.]|uniref:DUF1673 family protein n=1 Tax=Methanosarcina sp. TaxID=2213 RepID=UPI002988CB42|nr:DUF1673 family protein [Methanosarcina sp.]MDW5548897.1 DUF1673 family protein [Methanosarcina sp.]MDW5552600.1 DUF1673 family protein [Methanosarcina sp.]MDW5559156.1 DUF1673 family protein [Methanosarcina sp.]
MNWESRYIKKLMSWCPMKNSFQNQIQEGYFSGFEFENRSTQLSSSPADLQEGRFLKVQASLFDWWWMSRLLIVTAITLIISLLSWTFSSEDSYLIIFSGLIMFLFPLTLFLTRSNAATVMPGEIIIKQPMRKPIVIEKEDITQISVKKNEGHSLRWLIRLFYVIAIPLDFILGIPRNLQYIKYIEASFSNYVDFSLLLGHLAVVTIILVLFYNSELLTPYQWALKVTTHSKLELTFFTNKPEELTSFLKNERDEK